MTEPSETYDRPGDPLVLTRTITRLVGAGPGLTREQAYRLLVTAYLAGWEPPLARPCVCGCGRTTDTHFRSGHDTIMRRRILRYLRDDALPEAADELARLGGWVIRAGKIEDGPNWPCGSPRMRGPHGKWRACVACSGKDGEWCQQHSVWGCPEHDYEGTR